MNGEALLSELTHKRKSNCKAELPASRRGQMVPGRRRVWPSCSRSTWRPGPRKSLRRKRSDRGNLKRKSAVTSVVFDPQKSTFSHQVPMRLKSHLKTFFDTGDSNPCHHNATLTISFN